MHDSPIPQKDDAGLATLNHLDGAAPLAQATHLQDVEDVKQVRRVCLCGIGCFNRFEETFAVDRFWKNFCPANLEASLRSRIAGEKQDLQSGKDFAEGASQAKP